MMHQSCINVTAQGNSVVCECEMVCVCGVGDYMLVLIGSNTKCHAARIA